MSNYPKDPRVEFLESFESSEKKWFRYTWGIVLGDKSLNFDYVNLTRVTSPIVGYKTNHSEHAFIPDDDIFESDGAYKDFLFWTKLT
jgi:hypothetical protein